MKQSYMLWEFNGLLRTQTQTVKASPARIKEFEKLIKRWAKQDLKALQAVTP